MIKRLFIMLALLTLSAAVLTACTRGADLPTSARAMPLDTVEEQRTEDELATKELVGVWHGDMDFGAYLNDRLASDERLQSFSEYFDFSGITASVEYTFSSNGEYTCALTHGAWEYLETALESACTSFLTSAIEKELASRSIDMTAEEFLAWADLSVPYLVSEMMNKADLKALGDSIGGEGIYLIADGKLYLSDSLNGGFDTENYIAYELVDGKSLVLSDVADIYPVILTKE